MDEVRFVFGNEVIEVVVQVGSSRGIGVFHDDERATRVLDENCYRASCDAALTNEFDHFVGDFVGSFAVGADGKGVAESFHGSSIAADPGDCNSGPQRLTLCHEIIPKNLDLVLGRNLGTGRAAPERNVDHQGRSRIFDLR